MAIRKGERGQISMLPPSVEEYVGEDDPVRAYDAFIEALDIGELGLLDTSRKVGNPSYDPKSMLKLLVYGYSYGWRSSRKLERAVYHNLSFIWLMGGLKPDHKTIANFRRNNKTVLKKVLKQGVRLCVKLDLIEGNTLFVDGTKIRGNASINQTKTKEGWETQLKKVDEEIDSLFEECDRIDREEEGSLVSINKKILGKKKLKEKIESILNKMEEEKKNKINGTDSGASNYTSRQGTHAGYNAQLVTDDKHGLIVNADVVSENNDLNQFSRQIEQANEVLREKCAVGCADAGYHSVDDIKKITDQVIDVIMPSSRQAQYKDNPFGKDKFVYDSAKDQYQCPEGNILRYSYYSTTQDFRVYRMLHESKCRNCNHFGVCTKSRKGRTIKRLKNEELKQRVEAKYESKEGQKIYNRRKTRAEHPFGHIKKNLQVGSFLLRGLSGVQAEFSILANSFNIARLITLYKGVIPLVTAFKKIEVV